MAYYTFLLTDADQDTLDKMDLLSTMLNSDSCVLQQLAQDALPSATITATIDMEGPEAMLMFTATGVNESDTETFRELVRTALAQVASESFPADAVDATASAYRMSILLTSESDSVGVNIMPNIAYYWASGDDLYGFMHSVEILDRFTVWNTDGSFAAAAALLLDDSTINAMAVTVPVPGLKEQEDAALAGELAAIKASMTDEEIAALVAETNAENETNPDTAQYVRELTAVTVDSLPEETRIYDVTDETDEAGTRRMYVSAAADGIGQVLLRLRADGLTAEELQWASLYTDLLCDMDTTAHTDAELAALATRYLYDGGVYLSVSEDDSEEGCSPWLSMAFIGLDDELQQGYDLIAELLFETDFSDTETLKARVASLKTTQKRSLNSAMYSEMLFRMAARGSGVYAMSDWLNMLPYYNFLCAVEEQLETDPAAVTAQLNAVRDYFLNDACGAQIVYVGAESGRDANTDCAEAFLAALGSEPHERQTWDLSGCVTAGSEAIIADTNTTFNFAYATWEELGLEEYTSDLDALAAFVSDRWLMPLLRDANGAYGAYCGAMDDGIYLYTYRDPNVAESFEVFASLGELAAADTDIDQETLDGYILSCYSSYALSSGELTGGLTAASELLNGRTQEETLQHMHELKSFSTDTLKEKAVLLGNIMANGVYGTVSSASTVHENAALYGTVLNPFGVEENDEAVLSDVDASRAEYDAIYWCVDNQLMFPLEDGTFAPDAPVTLGEFAAPIYMMLGGGDDQDEAIELLASVGVMPQADATTVLTRENLVTYISCFYDVLGGDVDGTAPVDYADAGEISTGLETLWGWCVDNGLILPTADGLLAPQQNATRADCAQLLYVFFAE